MRKNLTPHHLTTPTSPSCVFATMNVIRALLVQMIPFLHKVHFSLAAADLCVDRCFGIASVRLSKPLSGDRLELPSAGLFDTTSRISRNHGITDEALVAKSGHLSSSMSQNLAIRL